MYPQMSLNKQLEQMLGSSEAVEPGAAKLFERVFQRGRPGALRKIFSAPTEPLHELSDVQMRNQHYMGMKTVDIEEINGTLNKAADFDGEFRPTQRHSEQRWLKVATAMMRGVELPPIELVKVGSSYYVRDGHHRVSVARALGYRFLDAEVVVWDAAEDTERKAS
ncbi:MAG: hypothetical protein ACOCYT_01135 [Chloroflexota bacterium]